MTTARTVNHPLGSALAWFCMAVGLGNAAGPGPTWSAPEVAGVIGATAGLLMAVKSIMDAFAPYFLRIMDDRRDGRAGRDGRALRREERQAVADAGDGSGIGPPGPTGPTGATGPTGPSLVVVTAPPAELPADPAGASA
jgi:hypothetical protein